MRSKEIVHFLHIRKNAGSQLRYLFEKINAGGWPDPAAAGGAQGHPGDLPPDARYFFSIRDPIARFKSGFYCRKRKSLPRYEIEWTAPRRSPSRPSITPTISPRRSSPTTSAAARRRRRCARSAISRPTRSTRSRRAASCSSSAPGLDPADRKLRGRSGHPARPARDHHRVSRPPGIPWPATQRLFGGAGSLGARGAEPDEMVLAGLRLLRPVPELARPRNEQPTSRAGERNRPVRKLRTQTDVDPRRREHQGDLPGPDRRPGHLPLRAGRSPTARKWSAASPPARAARPTSGCRSSTPSPRPCEDRRQRHHDLRAAALRRRRDPGGRRRRHRAHRRHHRGHPGPRHGEGQARAPGHASRA